MFGLGFRDWRFELSAPCHVFIIIERYAYWQKICLEMEQQKNRLQNLRAVPVAAPPEDLHDSDSRLVFSYRYHDIFVLCWLVTSQMVIAVCLAIEKAD